LERSRGTPVQAISTLERLTHTYPQAPQAFYELGAACFAANDFSKATESLQKALALNPNYLDATMLLARIQIQSGNAAPALAALETLRQKQPQSLPAQLLLADAYRMQNRVADALSIYQSLETIYPTNAQVRLLHGAAMLQAGDKAGARKALDQVLIWAPDDIPAIEQIVDMDLVDQQFADAVQLVNGKVQAYPKQTSLRILLAKIQIAQGRRDLAEATLKEVLAIDPNNVATFLLLAQVYSDSGDAKKAMERLDAVMAKDPKNVSALMLAAQIYEADKDYPGAAEAYEKLIKIDPKWSPALNNLACLYSEHLNKLDRAYELAQRAHELLPFNPEAGDTLGWICYQRGDYQAALGLLQDSTARIAATPGRKLIPEIEYHLGLAAYMCGDETTARAALQLATPAGANYAGIADCARFLALLNINPASADAAAVAELEKRKAEKPNDPVVLLRLARIYQRQGDTARAVANYEARLQAMPKDLDAMVNLAQLYTPTDTKKAYEMARTASKAAPYDPKVLHLLGRLALVSGDYQLAASTLQQALQNQPNDPSLLFDYARSAYSIGRVAEAQTALQNALAQNLAAPEAAPARDMLDLIALAAAPAQAAAASARIAGDLKSDPNNVPALMAQAAADEYNSNRAGAEQTCEKVLARCPDFTPAQMQLVRLYLTEPAHLDRAHTLAESLHNALPDDLTATKLIGIILVQRGDYSHAANLLQQCVLKTNSDAEIYYYLGAAQFHLKNRADSKASLQQALALKLPGSLADSAKQMLGQLK
jgi:tetratricopeptide (TPR) repeat protein